MGASNIHRFLGKRSECIEAQGSPNHLLAGTRAVKRTDFFRTRLKAWAKKDAFSKECLFLTGVHIQAQTRANDQWIDSIWVVFWGSPHKD